MSYFNWQRSGIKPAKKPYNHLSVNLQMIGIELAKRFGGHGIGGYASWVRLTPKGSPSTHGYGAAQDWGNWPNRTACEQAMQWLIDNHQALQIQMIGDYAKKRIWKVGRTTNPDPHSWWKPYPPMPGGTWIHIETGPIGQGFDNATPISERLGQPPKPAPVGEVHATVQRGDHNCTVALLQQKLGIYVDGDFGPKTEKAVLKFQKSHGLPPTGVVGPETWVRLP